VNCFVIHKDGLKYKIIVDESGKKGRLIGIPEGVVWGLAQVKPTGEAGVSKHLFDKT